MELKGQEVVSESCNLIPSFKTEFMKRLIFIYLMLGCSFYQLQAQDKGDESIEGTASNALIRENFTETLQTHLAAVSNKDLQSLKGTLSPDGKMHLILPGSEVIATVDRFIEYHEEWFQDTTWTFETKIIHTDIGPKIGTAITEIIYREPNRAGKPYFNRMIVTYVLEITGDQWYVIQDHASSIEKSTD